MKLRNLIISTVSLAFGFSCLINLAAADSWGVDSCNDKSTPISTPISLSINDVSKNLVSPTKTKFEGDYVVNVCRDATNSSYIVYLSNVGNIKNHLSDADIDNVFKVTFTPQAGDVPQIVDGHAHIESFSIAPNTNEVTLEMKPIKWTDIHGDDCGNVGPEACVAAVTKGSEDFNADLRVDVKFGSEYSSLQGMTWSAGSYYFKFEPQCPVTNGASASGLTFKMGGPHLMADNSTINSGFATVFMPNSAIKNCFGGTAADFVTNSLITRTEGATTEVADVAATQGTGLYYTLAANAAGLTIDIPTVTFSQPTYKMTKARSNKTKAAIIKAAHLKQKAGGTVRMSVKTPKFCVANGSKVYGIKKGTCRVGVTSYLANGKKYKSKTYKFKVK